jgi:hypothetical protein
MVCRGGETMVAGRAALMMDAVGPGDHLDPYRIDSRVARSGMTCIFRGGVQPDFFDRFHREAEIGRELDHPGVVRVLAGDDASRVYMAIE